MKSKLLITILTVFCLVSWMPLFGWALPLGLPKALSANSPPQILARLGAKINEATSACFKSLKRVEKPLDASASSPQEFLLAIEEDKEGREVLLTYLIKSVFRHDDIRVIVLRTENRIEKAGSIQRISSPETLENNQKMYLEEVMPLVHATNEKYEDRRHWGKTVETEEGLKNPFSIRRISVAEKHLLNSSYVLIYDLNDHLIGGIRNIQLLDQQGAKLPEEEDLQITVPKLGLSALDPSKTQWKNEIGSYFIDEEQPPELRQKVFFSLWTELYRFLLSKGFVAENFYNQVFHSYGDYLTAKMNRVLGFKKLRAYQYKGEWKNYEHLPENKVPPILPEGETDWEKGWWPLVLMPEDLRKTNERISVDGLSKVNLNWIVKNRHQLINEDQGTLQLGALFDQVMADLKSTDPKIFSSAKDGLIMLIQSFSEHRAVAHNHRVFTHNLQHVAIDNLKDIRAKINEYLFELPKLLDAMTPFQRQGMAEVVGVHLHADDVGSGYQAMVALTLFLLDRDPRIRRSMAQYLRGVFSAKEWLAETMAVLDLSIPQFDSDGKLFYSDKDVQKYYWDVLILKNRMSAYLRDSGFSIAEIETKIKKIRTLMFPPENQTPLQFTDADVFYPLRRSNWSSPSQQVGALIQLAAAMEYLENPIFHE